MSVAERFLVILVAGMSIPAFSREDARIEIDPHTRYQTIERQGGHVYPQTLPLIRSDPTFLEYMLDELHTTHIHVHSVWCLVEAQNRDRLSYRVKYCTLARSHLITRGSAYDPFLASDPPFNCRTCIRAAIRQ